MTWESFVVVFFAAQFWVEVFHEEPTVAKAPSLPERTLERIDDDLDAQRVERPGRGLLCGTIASGGMAGLASLAMHRPVEYRLAVIDEAAFPTPHSGSRAFVARNVLQSDFVQVGSPEIVCHHGERLPGAEQPNRRLEILVPCDVEKSAVLAQANHAWTCWHLAFVNI